MTSAARLLRPRPPFRASRWLAAAALAALGCKDATGPAEKHGVPGQIIVRTQPSGGKVGVVLTQQPIVELQDCYNDRADTSGVPVTVSIASGDAVVMSGGEAIAQNGIATFDRLTIAARAGTPVVLRFAIPHRSGTGLTVKTSAPITFTPGDPAYVRMNEQTAFSGAVGTAVTPRPSVTVLDTAQNPVPNVPVTFTVLQGNGRLQDSVVTTDQAGVARVGSWTLGLAGPNRLAARVRAQLETVFNATAKTTTDKLQLRVAVQGIPNAPSAPVRVVRTTPGGTAFDSVVAVTDTLTLTGIPSGDYAVIGDSVTQGARLWMPLSGVGNLTVDTTHAPDVLLKYLEHGRTEVTVRGLPTFNQPVTLAVFQNDTLFATLNAHNDVVIRPRLPLGTYQIIAPTLEGGGYRYSPTPAQQTVAVRGADTTAAITVQYAVTTGILTVTVAGLPAGTSAQLDVVGPGGYRNTFFMPAGTRSFGLLEPGSYTVTAAGTAAGATTYSPTPPSQTVTVSAGATATAPFAYTSP